ncbi:MAG: ATP-binding cassette domain-containing protein [Alphaproteobacteria bacterium]|nr:ATP-binding cassette domain-containing protein [Alphaproteobacteria bacterium]
MTENNTETAAGPEPKIIVRNLSKAFGSNVVLDGIRLTLKANESLAIIGGSGSGKSVLIKCMLGLIAPDKGNIWIQKQEVTKLSSYERQQVMHRFGMLFQGGALFDSMTVADNIAFGLIQGRGMDSKSARKIALEKLDAVDLSSSVADVYPAELSGGMQKRVALARAIAANPEIIFFDEPTTGLDPIVSGTINQLIRRCVKDLGASTITITHDIKSLRKIADRVGLLFKGKLIWTGTIAEMDSTDNPYVYQFINGLPEGPFTQ